MKRRAGSRIGDGPLRLRQVGTPELEALLDLARHRAAAHREAMAAIAAALFAGGGEGGLSDRERALMSEVLRKLVHDVERVIRDELAERVADRRGVPQELAVEVTDPESEVAHPVLVASGVLANPELIEAVWRRLRAHMLATSLRRRISETASVEAAAPGEVDVIARLLKDAAATVSRSVMEYLVAESKRVDTFQNPLIVRHDLPSEVLDKLYWWVAAALRRHLAAHYAVDLPALDDAIEATVTAALASVREELGRLTATQALIEEMARRRELSVPLLVQLLRQGEVSLFEAGFARVTRLNLRLVGRLLYEPGGEGLAIACKAVGFTRASFIAVYRLTRSAGFAPAAENVSGIARLVRFFDRVPRGTASAVVRHWRRNRGYLHATKRVGADA